jgi:hypothetical protein
VDVENIARPPELFAGGLVFEARVIGVWIVGPEYPRLLAVRAGHLIEDAGRAASLAPAKAAGELTSVCDRVEPAAVQDVGRYGGAYLVCVTVLV